MLIPNPIPTAVSHMGSVESIPEDAIFFSYYFITKDGFQITNAWVTDPRYGKQLFVAYCREYEIYPIPQRVIALQHPRGLSYEEVDRRAIEPARVLRMALRLNGVKEKGAHID